MPELARPVTELNGRNLQRQLVLSLPEGLLAEEVDRSMKEMAASAHRLLVINQCGGLPAPPVHKPSLLRRLLDLFSP
jgi:hypothetical protein